MNYGLKNKLKDDKLYEAWIGSLNERTASRYRYGIIAYCDYTKKSCTALINEAREDYINHVAPWELRHIKEFEGFVQCLKNDKVKRTDGKLLSNWAKLGYINAIRHFYQLNKIPVDKIKHDIPAMATEKYMDVPVLTLENIRKAVLSCGVDEKLTKALILTFLSSGQAQAEVQKLQGRHLKNLINDIAVVNMTRGKTKRRYLFFIGKEALEAIKEYKPIIGDDEFVFTQKTKNKPLNDTYIGMIFMRLAEKLGWDRAYFAPHRFRHYFKTTLSGSMETIFIEYLSGHKLPGVEGNYFLGQNQENMIKSYLKNQNLLTIFTDAETLQKQYDELKNKDGLEKELLKSELMTEIQQLKQEKEAVEANNKNVIAEMQKQMQNIMKYIQNPDKSPFDPNTPKPPIKKLTKPEKKMTNEEISNYDPGEEIIGYDENKKPIKVNKNALIDL